MNLLANLLTCLSLFFGFISIIFSLQRHFTFACWAIIISVVFDGLDGQVARMNPAPSGFGKELDSLADVVAFGIAPAILGYIYIYGSFYTFAATKLWPLQSSAQDTLGLGGLHFWATLALFFYLFCSVMRLAKYNITPKETMAKYFYGLPTTVSGGVLASFVLIYRRGEEFTLPESVPVIFLAIVLILSLLMISRIRYLNLDGIKQALGKYAYISFFILIVILSLATAFKKAGIAVSLIFLIYLIFSPFVVKSLNSKDHQPG